MNLTDQEATLLSTLARLAESGYTLSMCRRILPEKMTWELAAVIEDLFQPEPTTQVAKYYRDWARRIRRER